MDETQTAPPAGLVKLRTSLEALRPLSLERLRSMYVPAEHSFVFRSRRHDGGIVFEGRSPRYTAITLLGLIDEQEDAAREVLHGHSLDEVCTAMIKACRSSENLGDVALTTWVACRLDHADIGNAWERLAVLDPIRGSHPTVELAWSLYAATLGCAGRGGDAVDPAAIAGRLIGCFNERANLFAHWPADTSQGGWRSHVTCFADWVYPVQSLSRYSQSSCDENAMDIAMRAARHMLDLQGDDGQWWWHFDARTGRVLEKYPVYAVHQDAMAPMALLELAAVARGRGIDPTFLLAAGELGMQWLRKPTELPTSLIDTEDRVIWRKIARNEPGKLVRGLQAGASRLSSSLRFPGCDVLFPPRTIDYECRPYHLGWLLYAIGRTHDIEAARG